MAEIIDNARKGTPEAMRALYDQNKDRIMFLCQALLLGLGSVVTYPTPLKGVKGAAMAW